MKLARLVVTATGVLALATVAFAQKTDFSGTWTLDPASATAAGSKDSSLGEGPATVKQAADALTIERTPARWQCPKCAAAIERGAILRCSACGEPARMISGDEILLRRVELEVA